MNQRLTKLTAVAGLLIGGIPGLVGSFAPSPSLGCLAWGVDGVGLILATSLLTIYYLRKEPDVTAAGF